MELTNLMGAGLCLALCVSGCDRPAYRATAKLEQGLDVTLTLRPMLSLQSDWSRSLTITQNTRSVDFDISEDIGWWRGSNLYLTLSGALVLHEGQDGCYEFNTTPPSLVTPSEVSCRSAPDLAWLETTQDALLSYPASHYYPALFFVGHFNENGPKEQRAVFQPHSEITEPKLPDPI
jgi:hypothetical protein